MINSKEKNGIKIANLLRKAFLQGGKMELALYKYELEEHIDCWYKGLKTDCNECVFAVTENSGDVAMVLITKEKNIYINEERRDKLCEFWLKSYKKNIKLLIPMMAEKLANDILWVTGVKVVSSHITGDRRIPSTNSMKITSASVLPKELIMRGWVNDPHSGGVKIPEQVKQRTKERILAYAEQNYTGKYIRIDVRFKGYFCYIDAYKEPFLPDSYDPSMFKVTRSEYIERAKNTPIHLCRLRYKGNEEKWTKAFYTYSNEKYEPSVFNNGTFYGTPEEAFQSSALYLD